MAESMLLFHSFLLFSFYLNLFFAMQIQIKNSAHATRGNLLAWIPVRD